MKVILGFWELTFLPWQFPFAFPSLLLGLEAAVCHELSCHPSSCPLALPQQCKECHSKDSLWVLLGAWSRPGTGTSEGGLVSAGITAPTVFIRRFIGKIWNTVLQKSHSVGKKDGSEKPLMELQVEVLSFHFWTWNWALYSCHSPLCTFQDKRLCSLRLFSLGAYFDV